MLVVLLRETNVRNYFLAVLLMSLSSPVLAGFETGNKLMEYLNESEKRIGSYPAGVYTGYVLGVHDALDGIQICSPDGTTVNQIKVIVGKYLRAHPESWNQSAAALVIRALRQAYPCEKK